MALTLPSSNGASYLSARPESIQLNSHFNGGLTQTTATVTPTRLKNIEESFREHSNLPPKPELHQHMAGFVTPSVNISLFMKPPSHFNITNINLNQASHDNLRPIDYYNSSTNSNSNDSYGYSDDYSSEASSSAFENSSLSFNTIPEMNSSSSSRGKKASTVTSKSRKSNQSTNMAGSSQHKPKKSTGGGRKPTRNDKLTPEEEQKRAKRRERNKLAAARCRKRRLDQTNTLMDRVTDKEDEHLELVNKLNDLLTHMTAIKKHIEAHANYNCKSKRMLLEETELLASVDYEAMHEAMRPIDDEDDYSDLVEPTTPKPVVKSEPPHSATGVNFSSATSVIVSSNNVSANLINFANAISHQLQPSTSTSDPITGSLKRKRPNTLPVSNPYKVAAVSESSSNTFNTNPLQTPSSGLLFGDFDGGTGLTPLMPTLTPSELTPSTMAAFVKSLSSPMDESDQKKLIII